MVKALALFAVAGVAGAETVKLTYKDCGSSSTHAKITSLKPETIDVPGKATIVGSGALDSDQTSASFSLKVKKGIIPLVSGKGSICEDTTIKVPLGAGSFTVKGIDCPAKAGEVDVEVDLDILSDLMEDGENSLLSIHIEANADDTGDQVICLDVDASLASSERTPPVAEGTHTVLTFGDSWGDTGPTYKIIKQAFDTRSVPVDSKNRAVGGTTACGWASETKSRKTSATFAQGQALVNAAEEEFGEEGPEFVWYTLGGNDMADSNQHHECLKKAQSESDAQACVKAASDVAKTCTQQLLEPFFKKFPKSKVLQINYDVPCESALCDSTVVNNFMGGAYCNSDKECQNKLGLYWSSVYVEQLQKDYAKSHPGQYTGLNIFGTVQQANGIEGASPGHPVLDQDAGDCKVLHEILCIHPTYGTKMATAIGEQFWLQFFSKYVSTDSVTVV